MKNGGLGGRGSIKAGAILPSLKAVTPNKNNNSATPSTGIAQASKKNPIKQVEQIQDKGTKNMKMKQVKSQLAIKNEQEVVKYDDKGQWSIEKSNYKGYTPEDNARRKKNNLSEDTGIKAMPRIKQYSKQGANQLDRQVKESKAKTKKGLVTDTRIHPETGEEVTVSMTPTKLKNYIKKMNALAEKVKADKVKKTAREEMIEVLEKKLCERGKAAAKRKFDVYPSAYANMYASAVCSGKVKPGGKKKETKKSEEEVIKYDKNGQWSLE